jgi:hypothetical protein
MDGLALVAEALSTLSAAKAPAAGVFAKNDDQIGVEVCAAWTRWLARLVEQHFARWRSSLSRYRY